jgi:hypothetical protein
VRGFREVLRTVGIFSWPTEFLSLSMSSWPKNRSGYYQLLGAAIVQGDEQNKCAGSLRPSEIAC